MLPLTLVLEKNKMKKVKHFPIQELNSELKLPTKPILKNTSVCGLCVNCALINEY